MWVETDILPPSISGTLSDFDLRNMALWPKITMALNSFHITKEPGCSPSWFQGTDWSFFLFIRMALLDNSGVKASICSLMIYHRENSRLVRIQSKMLSLMLFASSAASVCSNDP